MPDSIFSNVSLTATRQLVDKFGELGEGFTDRIFLIGHADSDSVALNDPYLVVELSDTLEAFNNDANSPLIRAFLNCYHAGGRDIYLVRCAPMEEYTPYARRNTAWYETYYARLEVTYGVLGDIDQPMILVPLGADFEASRNWYRTPEGPDFLRQLTAHCVGTANLRYGLLPARLKWPNYLLEDPRITGDWREVHIDCVDCNESFLGDYVLCPECGGMNLVNKRTIDPRMYVGVVYGEGYFDRREIALSFTSDLCATVAGSISRMEAHLSPLCEPLHDVAALRTSLTMVEAAALAESRFIVVAPTWEGQRGKRGGYMLLNDNTMAIENSDYTHLSVLRLVQKVLEEIRPTAESYIGSPYLPEFRRNLGRQLQSLKARGIFRDYKVEIYTLPGKQHDVKVDLSLYPYLCHRWIGVDVQVGPDVGFEVI